MVDSPGGSCGHEKKVVAATFFFDIRRFVRIDLHFVGLLTFEL